MDTSKLSAGHRDSERSEGRIFKRKAGPRRTIYKEKVANMKKRTRCSPSSALDDRTRHPPTDQTRHLPTDQTRHPPARPSNPLVTLLSSYRGLNILTALTPENTLRLKLNLGPRRHLKTEHLLACLALPREARRGRPWTQPSRNALIPSIIPRILEPLPPTTLK